MQVGVCYHIYRRGQRHAGVCVNILIPCIHFLRNIHTQYDILRILLTLHILHTETGHRNSRYALSSRSLRFNPVLLPPPSSTFLRLPPCTVDAVPDTLRGMCGGRGEPGERGPTRICNGEGEGGSGVGAAGTKMVI